MPSSCVAVTNTAAVTYDASTSLWSSSPEVFASGEVLTSVSCASPTFCAAVDTNGGGYIQSDEGWTGRTVLFSTDLVATESVSCPTTTLCIAASSTGLSPPTTIPPSLGLFRLTTSPPRPVWTRCLAPQQTSVLPSAEASAATSSSTARGRRPPPPSPPSALLGICRRGDVGDHHRHQLCNRVGQHRVRLRVRKRGDCGELLVFHELHGHITVGDGDR